MIRIEEEMEIDEVEEIRRVRQIYGRDGIMSDINLPIQYSCIQNTNQRFEEKVFVVVDTNIFLNGTQYIKDIFASSEYDKFNLVIPWAVIQEIDHFKNMRNVKPIEKIHALVKEATKSVTMLNSWLKNRKSNIIFQTFADSNICIPEIHIESNDDKILQCCIQIAKAIAFKSASIYLLTDDMNLYNKAMILQISVFNKKEFSDFYASIQNEKDLQDKRLRQAPIHANCSTSFQIEDHALNSSNKNKLANKSQLDIIDNNDGKSNKQSRYDIQNSSNSFLVKDYSAQSTTEIILPPILKESIRNTLKDIICTDLAKLLHMELQREYKFLWEEIVLIRPPWTHIDVLICLQKHWIALFSCMWKIEHFELLNNLIYLYKKDESSEIQILTNLECLIINWKTDSQSLNSKIYSKLKNKMLNRLQFIKSQLKKKDKKLPL